MCQLNVKTVYHEGGATFGKRARRGMSQKNIPLLTRKHPDYIGAVNSFLKKDPIKPLRELLIFMTISLQSKNIACLFVGNIPERDPLFEDLFINAIIGKRPLIHLAPAENSVCNYLHFFYKSYQIDFAAYSAKEIEYLFSVIPVECVFSASGEFFANEFILAIRKLADSKREYRF